MVHNASSQQVLPPVLSWRQRLGLISLHSGENCGLYRGHECVPVDKKFQELKNDDDVARASNCILKKEKAQIFSLLLINYLVIIIIIVYGLIFECLCVIVSLQCWAVQQHWSLERLWSNITETLFDQRKIWTVWELLLCVTVTLLKWLWLGFLCLSALNVDLSSLHSWQTSPTSLSRSCLSCLPTPTPSTPWMETRPPCTCTSQRNINTR